jgi:uncharacterized protein
MSQEDDGRLVEVQIGRPLRARPQVVSRCHLGVPVVVEVPPVLDDGTPFPTLYWLTCPLARTRIGRLESGGGVRRMDARAASDPEFAARLEIANQDYQQARELLTAGIEGPLPSGGVGGSSGGVKCLHAHYAHTRAGGENPVGEQVSGWVEPLDCVVPCVVDGAKNPDWVMPK